MYILENIDVCAKIPKMGDRKEIMMGKDFGKKNQRNNKKKPPYLVGIL